MGDINQCNKMMKGCLWWKMSTLIRYYRVRDVAPRVYVVACDHPWEAGGMLLCAYVSKVNDVV